MNSRLKYMIVQNYSLIKKRLRFKVRRLLSPTRDKMIIFESFHGKRYADNVKAIYEKMLQDERYKDFRFVWAFADTQEHSFLRQNNRTLVIKKGTKKYYRYYATARFWVNNVSVPDFFVPGKNQIYIETWHGTPLKRLGCDITTDADPRQSTARMHRRYRSKGKKITYFLSPSPYYTEKLTSAFDLKGTGNESCIVETGYPRNDALFHYTEEDIAKIKKRIGIPEGRKTILYTPTWRDSSFDSEHGFEYTEALDTKKLMQDLGEDYILLFRAHHQVGLTDVIKESANVIDVTSVDDVNDLYIISDLMITDYSSTMYDYANLKRPMVYFMYDLEQYQNEIRGFYMDLEQLPGPIVKTQQDLTEAIRNQFENFQYDEKYRAFNETFNPWDDGEAAQRVLDQCITLEPHKKTVKERMIISIKRTKNRVHLLYLLLRYNVQGFFRKHGFFHNYNSRKLASYKNKYKGKRCFLIGNGPSLSPNDLQRLMEEYTFGTNMVYKIFNQTDWRPSFHCVSDSIYATRLGEELYDKVKSPLFTIEKTYNKMEKRPKNSTYVHCFPSDRYKVRGNVLAYCMVKATVLSLAAELAFHMGFKEIYLLGVDCTNPHAAGGHFTEDYSSKEVAEADLSRIKTRMKTENVSTDEIGEHIIDRSLEVYKKLKDYADKHGIKIYNATRGGNLEIFERVDFDEIVK